jgi:hypothetical protein
MRSCPLSFVFALSAVGAPFLFAACSSSSTGFPSGDDASTPEPEAGGSSSSGSGSSSGSSSGSARDGGSSGSSSGTGRVPSNITYDDAGIPLCGSTPCDLKTNECCLSPTLVTQCLPQSQSCPTGDAVFECAQETDCPSGDVCCGTANDLTMTAGSNCQDISTTGNACTPAATLTAASAQLCQTDGECKNGMQCIWQDCMVGTGTASLTMCGLQSSSPFNCKAHQ